jgi:hypothetical protein
MNKGFKNFANLSMDVRKQNLDADFTLVGFVNDPSVPDEYAEFIRGFTRQPLSPEEYRARAQGLTYVVLPLNPLHYRLVASSSFLDTLTFVKPTICLRSPYVEHYFQQLGDVGYLCDSYEEMVNTIMGILLEFPFERYDQQCRNILKARQIFTPEAVAVQVKSWASL